MKTSKKDLVASLPNTPGVYLFYGPRDELLYVGKSKSIRTRVRSHFSSNEERWVRRRVHRIETRETAGELGALLLESQLIKELRPMFNVAARRRRRIIVAKRVDDRHGYACISLEAVDYLHVSTSSPVMALFKHKTQAKEYLNTVAKTHRLCPKLLRLESARTYCFSYHLGHCSGACMGEESVEAYNNRFEQAFEERRIKAWPYDGGIVVEERSPTNHVREIFLVDNWCLIASFKYSNGDREQHIKGNHRFDYDSYKILYSFLTDEANDAHMSVVTKDAFDALLKGV